MIDEKNLSVRDTLFSGQCFRVSENDGVFTVFAGTDENVKKLTLSQNQINLIEEDSFWYNFFDLGTDYYSMKKRFSSLSPVMEEACRFAPGIRILNQNPWEALCSFVVSQNNNIKRIMGIIDRMCNFYGRTGENGVHGFPSAVCLSSAKEEDLRSLGLGFRASYIINTARAVTDGLVDFDKMDKMDVDNARALLMKIKGIGPKVADCALLFGMHRLDCFPMDVWMKRAMALYFDGQGKDFFGENPGVAQQYIFHWIRNKEKIMEKEV